MDIRLDSEWRVISCLKKILPTSYATYEFKLETRFAVDCDMDSLTFIEFLVAVEEEFGLNLSEDSLRLQKISTVGDMVLLIEVIKVPNAR